MLTVWCRRTSSNVQALMWCIGELGLAYRRHDAGHRYGGLDTPAFVMAASTLRPSWRWPPTAPCLCCGTAKPSRYGKRCDHQRLVSHTFLAGDLFNPADIQLGHVLYRYFDIEIPRPERPALRRYYESLTRRPAYREHVMVSYEELVEPI